MAGRLAVTFHITFKGPSLALVVFLRGTAIALNLISFIQTGHYHSLNFNLTSEATKIVVVIGNKDLDNTTWDFAGGLGILKSGPVSLEGGSPGCTFTCSAAFGT